MVFFIVTLSSATPPSIITLNVMIYVLKQSSARVPQHKVATAPQRSSLIAASGRTV